MRVAYLFSEVYPNYSLDFELFMRLNADELKTLDTVVKCGVWAFDLIVDRSVDDDDIQSKIVNLFYSGHGNLANVDNDILDIALSNHIYTVQLCSVHRHLALEIHERLIGTENYLGFTQVISSFGWHQIFNTCPIRYKVERGKIFVLFSETLSNDEWFADEIIQWVREINSRPTKGYLMPSVYKLDVGAKFTMLDANTDIQAEQKVENALDLLRDEWFFHSEQTIYALEDRIPNALEELIAAVQALSKSSLTVADCAHIAVNLRRTLEEITNFYCPSNDEKPGWVKRRWRQFADSLGEEKAYGQYIEAEASGIDDTLGRLDAMYTMGNKGVHESWNPRIFRGVVLRIVLLVDDLISFNRGKRSLKYNRDFWTFVFHDNE